MEILDRVGAVVAFLIYAYLLYQQNRILRTQNEIMQERPNSPASGTPGWRRYWPMLVMGLLSAVTIAAVALDYFYVRRPARAAAAAPADIPEFDDAQNDLYVQYGETTDSCYMNVRGERYAARRSGYKLAVACFVWDGREDTLDAPYLQVSSLYDIRDGEEHLEAKYAQYFQPFRKGTHNEFKINIALLNVPNDAQPSQFKTLREARAVGVRIPTIRSTGGGYTLGK